MIIIILLYFNIVIKHSHRYVIVVNYFSGAPRKNIIKYNQTISDIDKHIKIFINTYNIIFITNEITERGFL